MKSIVKKLFALGGVFVMGMSLASCGISKDEADKINQDIKDGKALTYDDLKKSYGDPTYDLVIGDASVKSGSMIWVKGCKTKDQVEEKWDKGEKLSALTVVLLLNKATSATWIEDFTNSDVK